MSNTRRIVLILAAGATAYCIYLLVGFVGVIADNGLPWEGAENIRDYYLAVGQAYSSGFAVGFFLCFGLAVMAFVVGSWYEQSVRDKAKPGLKATPPPSPGPPGPVTPRRAAVLPPA